MKKGIAYAKQSMGLDKRVVFTMVIISLISLSFLSYSFIKVKTCQPVSFTVKTLQLHLDSTYMAGEKISFLAAATNDNVIWDFGDNSEKMTGQFVTHIYATQGKYQVSASTGATCEMVKTITIHGAVAPTVMDENVLTGTEIEGPSSTVVGIDATFTCMVGADSYDWSISNYPKMTKTGSTASFTFPIAGDYIVEVTLNGDRAKRYSKNVKVEEGALVKDLGKMPQLPVIMPDPIVVPLIKRDPEEIITPANEKFIKISDDIFGSYLSKVIDEEMTASDFDKYLCYGGETKVILNGDMMTFSAMCKKIGGMKKGLPLFKRNIKIKKSQMKRDKDGCVNIIEIKYK